MNSSPISITFPLSHLIDTNTSVASCVIEDCFFQWLFWLVVLNRVIPSQSEQVLLFAT